MITTRSQIVPRKKDNYHHGSLRQALIAATDAILLEQGVEGFSLREAARRAGVSAAAPAHHFGSVTGLLTEVALSGFEVLLVYLRNGGERAGDDALARLHGMGTGYVKFGSAYPGRFQLMFMKDRLDFSDGRLVRALELTQFELESSVRRCVSSDTQSSYVAAAVAGYWSLLHGFTMLMLDGKFDTYAGFDADALVERFLPSVLAHFSPDAS